MVRERAAQEVQQDDVAGWRTGRAVAPSRTGDTAWRLVVLTALSALPLWVR